MGKNSGELFGSFTYSESMTYEALIENENILIEQLDNILKDESGLHIDFTPHGDLLMVQCAFETVDEKRLKRIAEKIASGLAKGIKGRLLYLETDLVACSMFWLQKDKAQGGRYLLPLNEPEGDIKKEK